MDESSYLGLQTSEKPLKNGFLIEMSTKANVNMSHLLDIVMKWTGLFKSVEVDDCFSNSSFIDIVLSQPD